MIPLQLVSETSNLMTISLKNKPTTIVNYWSQIKTDSVFLGICHCAGNCVAWNWPFYWNFCWPHPHGAQNYLGKSMKGGEIATEVD